MTMFFDSGRQPAKTTGHVGGSRLGACAATRAEALYCTAVSASQMIRMAFGGTPVDKMERGLRLLHSWHLVRRGMQRARTLLGAV